MDITTTGTFEYLGTRVRADLSIWSEVVARIGQANTMLKTLMPIWNSAGLSPKLKIQLLDALVNSILLYNSELWTAGVREMRMLRSFYGHALKTATRRSRRREIARLGYDPGSAEQIRTHLRLPTIDHVIRSRRMMWCAEVVRSEDNLLKGVLNEEVDRRGRWWRLIKKDLLALGIVNIGDVTKLSRAQLKIFLKNNSDFQA